MLLVATLWVKKAAWWKWYQVSGQLLGAAKQTSLVLLPQCVKPCGEISLFERSSSVRASEALIPVLGCAA